MEKIDKKLFEKRLRKMGIKRQVDSALVCQEFNAAVKNVLGSDGARNIEAVSFNKGTLKVKTASSIWGQELFLKKEKLLANIEEVKDLKLSY
ncbi:MAG: hypothetical protein UT66_C0026G0021 [candidate division CPR2 bacterium GW2011_GWC1_39_9]|uniref:DUF721 domain-containing protein n=1 Tax=candidate division CPR2 bacterium GW2011_GWC2_39_10 TaxID=1618345 RepID=A0A0G0LSU2_UNCC2|nr:MAG: hypothetical protein UT18_C0005G0018 [candidate division CPR2 bacterium GW2011_GWC2_39_10]KKR34269.1 MAG: hypothetical protein UT66_C0026G0021 [candidate division CPR2 bacterium GW2011_GWC1_39_9]